MDDKFKQKKPKSATLLCENETDEIDEDDEDIQGETKQMRVKKNKIDSVPLMTFPLRINHLIYEYFFTKFLGFNNSEICYSKNANKERQLAQQKFCILRHGIIKNKKQSFS